ncbi:hypothetical protein [Xanthobacter agilis]|jgi:hypothetical protein|uniref:Flagellar FliJ protein n=1 Tax=Xanthobacter agilis TaxID=47492 RepID=A0ABU0LHT6_XANAG|nr:hypothetical protein [Xanthobacter agilis]MDQ0506689.1 hypothetical protein [Xanthobacter agilis]
MKERLKKAERIRVVREQLQRSAEWRLAALAREQAAIEDQRRALLLTVADDLFGPMLLEQAVKRLGRLATDAEQADARKKAQEQRVKEEALALKRAEHVADEARRDAQTAEERTLTAEIAEASALRGRRDASFT